MNVLPEPRHPEREITFLSIFNEFKNDKTNAFVSPELFE